MSFADPQKYYTGRAPNFRRGETVLLTFKTVLKTGQFLFSINMSQADKAAKHDNFLRMYYTNSSHFKMQLGNDGIDMLMVMVIDPLTYDHFRGQVFGEPNSRGEVDVLNVDSGETSICLTDQFYYISKDYLEVPFDTILCHFNGLTFFEGTNLMQRACEDVVCGVQKLLGVCVGEEKDLPVFQVKDRNGIFLHTALLKYIYKNAPGILPPRRDQTKIASIPYIKFDGEVWIHLEDSFILDLEDIIGALKPQELKRGVLRDRDLNREEIYLAKQDADEPYYRCRFLKRIATPGGSETKETFETKAQIHFIDYGNDSIVPEKYMLSAGAVNIALAHLPPLAHRVYLKGLRQLSNIKLYRSALEGRKFFIEVRKRVVRGVPTVLLFTQDPDGTLKRFDANFNPKHRERERQRERERKGNVTETSSTLST